MQKNESLFNTGERVKASAVDAIVSALMQKSILEV